MAMPVLNVRNQLDDDLLRHVVAGLQLTPEQYEQAVVAYHEIGVHLCAAASPFAYFYPEVYVQGSMAAGTTVRPWKHVEFDLDAVARFMISCSDWKAAELIELVFQHFQAIPKFSEMVEKKDRCVRFNHPGQFHLDLVPACFDSARVPTGIRVPDRKADIWKLANPKALLDWFRTAMVPRTTRVDGIVMAGKLEPAPPHATHLTNTPLQIALQLIKRHRDLFFDDMCELSTPSVLLTVIAGLGYHGSSSIYETLVEVAQNLAATALSEAAPVVRNPGDSSEIISEKWHSLPDAWLQFRRWSAELARLLSHATDPLMALEKMVGRDSVKRGFELQAKAVAAARQSGNLRVSNTGKLAASAASSGTLVKPHHFYGE